MVSFATPKDEFPVLTLTIGWDGVVITEDNKKTMWPLVAFLNELPFQERIMNPMLIALHSGSRKPSSDIMLRPLVDELVHFENNPISITVDGEAKSFYIKLLLVIADAPARAVLLNCGQYNSKNGTIRMFCDL